jgi:hypothetical protein
MSIEAARALWTVLAEASLRATVAAALAAVILFVTRTRVASVRHAVWASITATMLAMPFLSRTVPPVAVAALPTMDVWAATAPVADAAATVPVAAVAIKPHASNAADLVSARTPIHSPAEAVSTPSTWPVTAAFVYLAALFASLVYASAGWLAMTTIVRRSRRVLLPDGSAARESPLVAAPLTAGVFTPCVITKRTRPRRRPHGSA